MTVSFGSVSGNHAIPGVDYEAVTGLLTFLPGQIEQIITIKVYGDTEPEPGDLWGAEWLLVVLVNPSGAVLASGPWGNAGFGLIIDDD